MRRSTDQDGDGPPTHLGPVGRCRPGGIQLPLSRRMLPVPAHSCPARRLLAFVARRSPPSSSQRSLSSATFRGAVTTPRPAGRLITCPVSSLRRPCGSCQTGPRLHVRRGWRRTWRAVSRSPIRRSPWRSLRRTGSRRQDRCLDQAAVAFWCLCHCGQWVVIVS